MTYDEYWAVVLGASRSAGRVVDEFCLGRMSKPSIDEWLLESELDAIAACDLSHGLVDEWLERGYRARALRELTACIEEAGR